jgi:hypothetical protein
VLPFYTCLDPPVYLTLQTGFLCSVSLCCRTRPPMTSQLTVCGCYHMLTETPVAPEAPDIGTQKVA